MCQVVKIGMFNYPPTEEEMIIKKKGVAHSISCAAMIDGTIIFQL